MDLRTSYLGLDLSSPFMPGASPLVDDLDVVRRLEDAGAAAIVMHSLFEEQIAREQARTAQDLEAHVESFAEASSFFPRPGEFRLGPHEYLEQLRRIKQAVSVPVIASLNGITASGWLDHAQLIEQAGADALELNVYHVATDPEEDGVAVEQRLVDIAQTVRRAVRVPVAVKLSPFYTSLPSLVRALERTGVQGLVLFNRFYQPDIDPESLEVVSQLRLSTSGELLLRLRWLAVLAGRTRVDLACSGGVHTARDAIKAIMAGATAVQTVSMLLKRGPEQLAVLLRDTREWFEQHDYESLAQARGSMSLARCPDPAAFERGNYVRILQSWSD